MNTFLAQLVALAAHAKARRLDRRLAGDEAYWREHSTFRFVGAIKFRTPGSLFRSAREVADAPAGWIERLPPNAEVNLFLFDAARSLPAHVASMFTGGVREGIATTGEGGSALWAAEWTPVAQYPETRIWSITYSRWPTFWLRLPPRSIGEAQARLQRVLGPLIEFAAQPGLTGWRGTFEKAAGHLAAADPRHTYHPDLLPEGAYPLAARQLLAASAEACVFGGMGSWNDLGFEDPQRHARYENLTRQLYDAVMNGLVTAVNAGLV